MPVPDANGLRFVVDENLLRLGRALMGLRRDVGSFGTAPLSDLLPQGILDPDWIPIVAARGWIVVTSDGRLRTRPAEASLAVEVGLKTVHLSKAGHLTAWDQMRRLIRHWDTVEAKAADRNDGPWWLDVRTSTTLVMRYEPGVPARAR